MLTSKDWKASDKLKKEIQSAAKAILACGEPERLCDIEDIMVDGPYLDNIYLGMTDREEGQEENESDRRMNYLYDQVLKATRAEFRKRRS